MSYLNDMLKKANLQGVREYLMFGEPAEKCLGGYEERLSKAYKECLNVVKQYDSKGEESELFKAAIEMATEHENIYMELGLRAGIQLATDIGRESPIGMEEDSLYKEMYVKFFKSK